MSYDWRHLWFLSNDKIFWLISNYIQKYVNFIFWPKLLQRIYRFYFYLILLAYVRFLPAFAGHCMAIKIWLDSSRSQQPFTFNKGPAIHLLKKSTLFMLLRQRLKCRTDDCKLREEVICKSINTSKKPDNGFFSSMSFFPHPLASSPAAGGDQSFSLLPWQQHFILITRMGILEMKEQLSRLETFSFCCKWQQVPFWILKCLLGWNNQWKTSWILLIDMIFMWNIKTYECFQFVIILQFQHSLKLN